jgi:hypothetical protein
MYIEVSAPGYASWRSRDAELQTGEHAFDVALGPLRSVALELRRSDGTPVDVRARARFERLDGAPQWVAVAGSESSHAELEHGEARVSGLPADRLRVTFEVAELGEETFDLDLRVEPGAPVVFHLRTASGPDFPVELFIATPLSGADTSVLDGLDEAELARRIFFREGLVPPDVPLEVSVRDERGAALLAATLAPHESRWKVETTRLQRGTSSISEEELAVLRADLPGRSRRLAIRAEGYPELRFALDPTVDNGGLPRLVLLVP